MKAVGDKLREWAINENDDHIVNMFGRSAVNRYYYATFISVVCELVIIDDDWKYINHKDIPAKLSNKLNRYIKNNIKRQYKSNSIDYEDKMKYINIINESISSLSSLMKEAYSLRVKADYDFDEKAIKNDGKIIFCKKSLSHMQSWHSRANKDLGRILKVCKKLGIL